MSHMLAFAVVPAGTTPDTVDGCVTALMAPYDENEHDDGRWDWWQIGGRWTGLFDDYDPHQDPANHKKCWLCDGTGMRNDAAGRAERERNPDYTCNGCMDGPEPGVEVEWPTHWKRHEGDMVTVAWWLDQPEAQTPFAVVTADGWQEHETWDGNDFVKTPDWDKVVRETLERHIDARLVVVDYHS